MMTAMLLYYVLACKDLSTPLPNDGWNVCQFSEPTKWCGASGGLLVGFGCELTPDYLDIVVDPATACLATNGPQRPVPPWPTGQLEMKDIPPVALGTFKINTSAWTAGSHVLCVRAKSKTTTVVDQWVMVDEKDPNDKPGIVLTPPMNLRFLR